MHVHNNHLGVGGSGGGGGGHAPSGNLDPLRLLLVECNQFPTETIIKPELLVLVR